MNVHLLINALGGIDDDLIRAADEEIPRQRKRPIAWRKIAALAACLTLLTALTAALMLLPGNRSHTPSVSGDETTAPIVTTGSYLCPSLDYYYTACDSYVIITIKSITKETEFTEYPSDHCYRVACEVVYVNSTQGLGRGPYYEQTRIPLITAVDVVDIWFPEFWMSSLEEGKTLLLKLEVIVADIGSFYVPSYYDMIDGDQVTALFFENEKLVIGDEIDLLPFHSLKTLNNWVTEFKQYYPDRGYPTEELKTGATIQETIDFFERCKQATIDFR